MSANFPAASVFGRWPVRVAPRRQTMLADIFYNSLIIIDDEDDETKAEVIDVWSHHLINALNLTKGGLFVFKDDSAAIVWADDTRRVVLTLNTPQALVDNWDEIQRDYPVLARELDSHVHASTGESIQELAQCQF
jgi:hypothetical protein